MRRLLGVTAGILLLVGCNDLPNQPDLDVPGGSGTPSLGTSSEIVDASTGAPGANPHFYWLSPVADKNPDYSGVADDNLRPVVTVCSGTWDTNTETCSDTLALFSMDAADPDDQITLDPGVKYSVVWKTSTHPVQDLHAYNISVSVMDRVLGWVDVRAYDQQTYNSFQHTDPEGYVAISDNGSLNIKFRIEEGALESEFCDTSGIEDCDVAIIDPQTGGEVHVFELPGQSTQTLGSMAQFPPGGMSGGAANQEPYLAILKLHDDGVFQPGQVPQGQQVPYFADLQTYPEGITFPEGSEGIRVVLCQDLEGQGAIDESLHDFLVVFLTEETSAGTTTTLLPTTIGAPECGGYSGAVASSGSGSAGLFSRLASGLTSVKSFLLPAPLYARRRVHGGLNTVIRSTKSDGTSLSAPAQALSAGPSSINPEPTGDEILALGAILNVDALTSSATVPATGVVGSSTTITVNVVDAQNLPFPFDVDVTIAVSGANTANLTAVQQPSGHYEASYTPTAPGTDNLVVTVAKDPVLDPTEIGTYTSEVYPVGASAGNTTFVVSSSEEGSPTTVTVTVLDENGQPYLDGEEYPIDVQVSVTPSGGASAVATAQAEDDDGNGNFDGTYVATYTPDSYGDFDITVTVNGDDTGDSPQTITTAPRPADASLSAISAPDGRVDSPKTVSVAVKNTAGEAYVYGDIRPITVEVTVSGANDASFSATDSDLDGTYEGSYTPSFPGTDRIDATIDGEAVTGTTSEVAPLSGDMVVIVSITGGAPSDGLPVYLYQGTDPDPVATAVTAQDGSATFADLVFGEYVVHLPKRDFDVQYAQATQTFTHSRAPDTATFTGSTQGLPSTARVWRIRLGGSGNAFQYIVGGRSWTSAQNQVRDAVLLGVQGHLATLTSAEENTFVADYLFQDRCPNTSNPKQCKYKGWIGLTDEVVEGDYRWVTGEAFDFASWPDGVTPVDRKGNQDYVETGIDGLWDITNGASTTNEGYFVEWEVTWPTTPPPLGGGE